MMAFKLVLEQGGDHFRREIIPQEAAKIASQLCEALEPFFADADESGPPPRDQRQATLQMCAELLIQLKFELLLAPKRYQIRWVSAGAPFNGLSMQGMHNEESRGESRVRFCVCPGLEEYDPVMAASTMPENFDSLLVCHKSFFPQEPVNCQNVVVVAESLVSVEGQENVGSSLNKGKRVERRQRACTVGASYDYDR